MNTPKIIDAHLDLSMNAIDWNRDIRQNVASIRHREHGQIDKPDRGRATVSFPELKKGNIRLCVATLIARYVKPNNDLPGWHSPAQAWSQTQAQLSWYQEMSRQGYMRQIKNHEDLKKHLSKWDHSPSEMPLGYILSLEGADSIISLNHLYEMHDQGLRAIGPAHYGPGTYAFGTDSDGSIGDRGRELLMAMQELNIILDVTHLCDTSFWEAMDCYSGPLWASHSNCRSLVDHNRQFSDEQLKEIISKGGIIGLPLDAWMMIPNWERGVSSPQSMGVSLTHMVDHMDHICQIAGNTNHIMIGTDLDGGFGTEQCPIEIDTIADLQKIPQLLTDRGYNSIDIEKILSQNFVDFITECWTSS